ncbi:hypothetical protein CDV36_009870 [Fusarium kuroshium]|uniref:Uncharacterized protein n=1 Tax=Fusarium kuroshium TaxID=2010991 RepID=A0A3M2RYV4_9HYPO|nr:hypothetical protein CDV36_009870 [Fusarium kuroshium]
MGIMNMVVMSIIMRVITDMVITMVITRHIAMDTMKAIVMDMDIMRLTVTDTAKVIVMVTTKSIATVIAKITAMDMIKCMTASTANLTTIDILRIIMAIITTHHRHGHLHPHYHHHHTHHSHPIRPCYILTEKSLCRDLYILAEKADHAAHLVQTSLCRQNSTCWNHIREAIYKLEYGLDLFDKYVDHTTLEKCFTRSEEAVVTKCYIHYAQSVIRLLKVTHESGRYLEGEVDRPILTAINSLRAADRAFVLDLGRRIESKESLKVIMRKQGAEDGTTGDSVQEAFNRFIFTPLITGEDFKNHPSEAEERARKIESYGKGGRKAMDMVIMDTDITDITVMDMANMESMDMDMDIAVTDTGITNMESMDMDITAMDMNMVTAASTVVLRGMARMEVTPRLFLMFERARMVIIMFITTGIIMATREVITTDIIMVIITAIRRTIMSFTGIRTSMVTATTTDIIMGKSMVITTAIRKVTMRLTSTRMSMAMGTSTVMATDIRKAIITATATRATIMSRPLTPNPTQEEDHIHRHRFHDDDDVESSNSKTSPYSHYHAKEQNEHVRPKNRDRDGHCDDERHHGKGKKDKNIHYFIDEVYDEEDSKHNGRLHDDHRHHDSPYRHHEKSKHKDRKDS